MHFSNCQAQRFAEGFDTTLIDPSLDGSLSTFPEEEPLRIEDDEFASLLDEVEKLELS
ncbi:UNVERIFIED_CONTAM: hypothetical protein Slati_2860500 [Sesamum latifolium]|uniref:Uncharacterized protein n=1 Tax=Sesamum latifolium TaxID=2727402 RepID=A0AAW2VFC5_9LAMI